jgi:hypothetical protein
MAMTRARLSDHVAVLVLVAVCLNLATTVVTAFWLVGQEQHASRATFADSPPCAALPVRFVHEEPACADKLLRAMNISNVHITQAEMASLGRTGDG